MKHPYHLVLVLIIISFLGGCALAVIGGGAAVSGYYIGKDERSAKRIATDLAITTKINAEFLADDHIKTFKIGVKTYRGVVSLTGKVPSQDMLDQAVEIAETMEGVREVNSLLTLE